MRILLTDAQKYRAADEAYRKQIVAAMAAEDWTMEDLAHTMGISRNTLAARLKNTAKLTRGEDRILRRALRMEEGR